MAEYGYFSKLKECMDFESVMVIATVGSMSSKAVGRSETDSAGESTRASVDRILQGISKIWTRNSCVPYTPSVSA